MKLVSKEVQNSTFGAASLNGILKARPYICDIVQSKCNLTVCSSELMAALEPYWHLPMLNFGLLWR